MDSYEEQVERMVEVEHEIEELVEDARRRERESGGGGDGASEIPTGASGLDYLTGRVVRFESRHVNDAGQVLDRPELEIHFMTQTGDVVSDRVVFPEDPFDRSEPLVRLCEYMDVPIERIASMGGETIPIRRPASGSDGEPRDPVIEIPPVYSRGNRVVFWAKRGLRKRRMWFDALLFGVFLLSWIPAAVVLHFLYVTDFTTLGALLIFPVFAIVAIGGGISLGFSVLGVAAAVGWVVSMLRSWLFPSE